VNPKNLSTSFLFLGRNAMVRAPVLALPNATDPFILDTDASDKSVGAELIQIQEGEERAVAYGSLTLTPEQQKYCTTRKELLAIIRFSRQFRHYLLGSRTGALTIAFLNSSNAFSCSSPH
jgi:hypothetical protein